VAAVVRGAGGRAGGGGGGAAVGGGVRGGKVLEAGLAAGGVRVRGQGRGRGGGRRGGGGFGARWRGDDGRALQDLVADAARLPVPARTPEEKSVRWNSAARGGMPLTPWAAELYSVVSNWASNSFHRLWSTRNVLST
jgi:hypothetical protein